MVTLSIDCIWSEHWHFANGNSSLQLLTFQSSLSRLDGNDGNDGSDGKVTDDCKIMCRVKNRLLFKSS